MRKLNALALIIGVLIAVAIVLVVDTFLVPKSGSSDHLSSTPAIMISYLESGVVFLVFGAFLKAELIHLIQGLLQILRGQSVKAGMPLKGIVILFVAVSASAAIYVAFIRMVPDNSEVKYINPVH